jgi:hypothetical protein
VKKLISIGVVLALVAIVVLPLGVAAQEDCGYSNVTPDTYAKIPFAILETGLLLVGDVIGALPETMGIPPWIADITDAMAPWVGGPLSWTVDMLGWGIELLSEIVVVLQPLLGLPADLDLAGLLTTVSCKLFTPFTCVPPGANDFNPCGAVLP